MGVIRGKSLKYLQKGQGESTVSFRPLEVSWKTPTRFPSLLLPLPHRWPLLFKMRIHSLLSILKIIRVCWKDSNDTEVSQVYSKNVTICLCYHPLISVICSLIPEMLHKYKGMENLCQGQQMSSVEGRE